MSDVRKAVLLTTGGTVEVISWDHGDHTEAVREALAGVPAPVEGADWNWAQVFGRDPDIHPQGDVNVICTYANQRMHDEGKRIYAFGDVVICPADEDGNPRGFTEEEDFFVEHLTGGSDPSDGMFNRFAQILSNEPRVVKSIEKLEDVRPDEEKETAPQ